MTNDFMTKMKCWKCTSDVVGYTDVLTWVEYVWSTSEPTIKTIEDHWKIYSPEYWVKNFKTEQVAVTLETDLHPHIIHIRLKGADDEPVPNHQ